MLYVARDFVQFYNPLHGNCYVYNSGWNSSVKLKNSTKSGRRHGLWTSYFERLGQLVFCYTHLRLYWTPISGVQVVLADCWITAIRL